MYISFSSKFDNGNVKAELFVFISVWLLHDIVVVGRGSNRGRIGAAIVIPDSVFWFTGRLFLDLFARGWYNLNKRQTLI